VNVQQRPNRVWYTQAHDLAERAVGFVSNDHGDKGGGKGSEAQTFPGLTGLTGGKPPHTCLIACAWVWCGRFVVEQHYVTHPSVQLTRRSEAT
jgi:hypothetical protein